MWQCSFYFTKLFSFSRFVCFCHIIVLYCNVSLYFVFLSSFIVTFLHGFLFLLLLLLLFSFSLRSLVVTHGIISTFIIYSSPSLTLFLVLISATLCSLFFKFVFFFSVFLKRFMVSSYYVLLWSLQSLVFFKLVYSVLFLVFFSVLSFSSHIFSLLSLPVLFLYVNLFCLCHSVVLILGFPSRFVPSIVVKCSSVNLSMALFIQYSPLHFFVMLFLSLLYICLSVCLFVCCSLFFFSFLRGL